MYFAYPCKQKVIRAGKGLDALWFANMCTACYGSNTRQFLHHLLKNTQSRLRSTPFLADQISASHMAAEFNHAGLGFRGISSHSHEAPATRAS